MTHKSEAARAERMARRKIVVERTYPAELQDVWDLWTTKDGFESWWGPVGFRVEVHTLEAQIDGRLHYDMIADTPEMIEAMKQMSDAPHHAVRARFTEFQPQSRLALTNVIDFLPGVPTYESTIVAEFFPSGKTVRMVVTLDPMHSEEMSQMQLQGFSSQLTKLDKRFGIESQ